MNSTGEKQSSEILRGDIVMANLSPGVLSEFQGLRPCLVIQDNMGNKFSPTVTIIPLSSVVKKRNFPMHVQIEEGQFGLTKASAICAEGIRTIDKSRFEVKIGCVDSNTMVKVEKAVLMHLGCPQNNNE